MTLCNHCSKPIIGQYHYSKEKNDDKKFCSAKCMHEHYGFKCEECGKILPGISIDKDGKKFCGTTCVNKYSNNQVSDIWEKYKGWIIAGGVIFVSLFILGLLVKIFGKKQKKQTKI